MTEKAAVYIGQEIERKEGLLFLLESIQNEKDHLFLSGRNGIAWFAVEPSNFRHYIETEIANINCVLIAHGVEMEKE